MESNFSILELKARNYWGNGFKSQRENDFQPRMLYLVKLLNVKIKEHA